MKVQRTPNPEDRTTFERDFDETRFGKQILGVILFIAIIAFGIWRAAGGG